MMQAILRMRIKAFTFALSILGAALAYWIGLPLPWMLGPLFLLTTLSVYGLKLEFPDSIRGAVFALVGIYLGSSIAQGGDLFKLEWVSTLLVMVAFTLLSSYLGYLYFRYIAGFGGQESFLASLPGALAFISSYIIEHDLPPAKIILAQSIRVVIVVGFTPLFYTWYTGNVANDINELKTGGADLGWVLDFALVIACSVPVIWIWRKTSIPNAWFLGGMFTSSLCYLGGITDQKLPTIILQILLILIGTMIGIRFAGTQVRQLLNYSLHGIAATVILLVCTFGVVYGTAAVLEQSPIKLLLSFAPGGVHEMAIIAFAYSIEPIFVTFHHVLRITVISFLIPLLIGRLSR